MENTQNKIIKNNKSYYLKIKMLKLKSSVNSFSHNYYVSITFMEKKKKNVR